MRLTVKSEYACLALIYLAQHYRRKQLLTIGSIARKQKIPKKYLEQILLTLKRSAYVKSDRGAKGGYFLAKSPEKITLAEILRLLDGPLAPVSSVSRFFYRHSPAEQNKKLTLVFKEVRDLVSRKLERITFADLV